MPPIQGEIIKGLPPQLKTSIGFYLAQVVTTFVVGEVTQNYSQGWFALEESR